MLLSIPMPDKIFNSLIGFISNNNDIKNRTTSLTPNTITTAITTKYKSLSTTHHLPIIIIILTLLLNRRICSINTDHLYRL